MNAEFQRIARRNKKAFFNDQCKEIEENNRMGKTGDLLKKIIDIKGTFHAKMGSIKNRNGMDLTEAQAIKKSWKNKMDNLEEMDKYLEKYNFPKLNQEEIEDLNRPITSKEILTVIRNLPANKSSEPDYFTADFYQKFREELTPILHKLFQKIAECNLQSPSMRPPLP